MPQPIFPRHSLAFILTALLFAGGAPCAIAQNNADDERRDPVTNRRISDEPPVVLNFKDVPVRDTLEFIMQTSGKTVIPSASVISLPVTVVNDVALPRHEALNRLFIAFLDYNIGVVETPHFIKLNDMQQIARSDCPIVGAGERLAGRSDEGVIINKVFQLRYVPAQDMASVLTAMIPDTWASIEVEPNSNSIIALCSVGLGKKLERVVDELDREKIYDLLVIRLDYADAADIADRILRAFGPGDAAAPTGQQRQPSAPTRPGAPVDPRRTGGVASGPDVIWPTGGVLQLRTIADSRNNTVTVVGEPQLLKDIESHVRAYWDHPLQTPGEIVRTYQLRYRDVIVIRDLLNQLSGAGAPVTGARPGTRVAEGGAPGAGGAGGSGGAFSRIADLYFFQADPGANQLIVAAKTARSFEFIDDLIRDLDQPNEADRPTYIELKHADAFDIAQQINTVYARDGARGSSGIMRQEGLTQFEVQVGTSGTAATGGDAEPTEIVWPWQDGQLDPNIAPVSPLIGKFRVMPVTRQNAVMIVGPPHYRDHIAELIEQLDRPGRQVLITGVIAEVELGDDLSLGLRFSSGSIPPSGAENFISIGAGLDATRDDVLSGLFDTSVLDVSANLNLVFEALKRDRQVRILSEPRIFTHDNEQANFFDGQLIQVLSQAITDATSINVTQSFDDRLVGIILSVRPRITANRDVDLLIDLELSSLTGQTTGAGGLIFDQRNTQTRVIVRDRQTVVISGILREQESRVVRRVPILGEIPLLGALFSSTSREKSVSELIAFITPIVVENPSETDRLNEDARRRMDELKRPIHEQRKDFGEPWQIWQHQDGREELDAEEPVRFEDDFDHDDDNEDDGESRAHLMRREHPLHSELSHVRHA